MAEDKEKETMVDESEDRSHHSLPPEEEAESGSFPMRDIESYKPLGELIPAKRVTGRSIPSVVRFETEVEVGVEETPITSEFEEKRSRRMSDPGGALAEYLAAEGDMLDEELEASGTNQEGGEDQQSDWEIDWQDFVTHGAFTGPVVLDTEEEAAKRLPLLSPYLPQMLAHTALYDTSEFLSSSYNK